MLGSQPLSPKCPQNSLESGKSNGIPYRDLSEQLWVPESLPCHSGFHTIPDPRLKGQTGHERLGPGWWTWQCPGS